MKKLLLLLVASITIYCVQAQVSHLKVSHTGRHFVNITSKGEEPVLLIGDTGWKIMKLTEPEIGKYFNVRSGQGFNLVLCVMINFENDNFVSTPDSIPPLLDKGNLASVNENYLKRFDYVLGEARKNNLYLGVIPFWAQAMERFDKRSLWKFGEIIGKRYANDPNIIWISGGEAAGETRMDLVEALAVGLKKGSGSSQLMSVHPSGNLSSSMGQSFLSNSGFETYNYHTASWLDFNMIQSGHHKNHPNYELITRDYNLLPAKPVIESEYFYENHPSWESRNHETPYRAQASDVRKGGYWAIFSGAAGYVYGHHAVWQFFKPGNRTRIAPPTTDWESALTSEGALQMQYLKKLMLTSKFEELFPDEFIIVKHSGNLKVSGLRNGSRYSGNASRILVYLPEGGQCTLNTGLINSKKIRVSWFNPRTGIVQPDLELLKNPAVLEVKAPDQDDWVLIITGE